MNDYYEFRFVNIFEEILCKCNLKSYRTNKYTYEVSFYVNCKFSTLHFFTVSKYANLRSSVLSFLIANYYL